MLKNGILGLLIAIAITINDITAKPYGGFPRTSFSPSNPNDSGNQAGHAQSGYEQFSAPVNVNLGTNSETSYQQPGFPRNPVYSPYYAPSPFQNVMSYPAPFSPPAYFPQRSNPNWNDGRFTTAAQQPQFGIQRNNNLAVSAPLDYPIPFQNNISNNVPDSPRDTLSASVTESGKH